MIHVEPCLWIARFGVFINHETGIGDCKQIVEPNQFGWSGPVKVSWTEKKAVSGNIPLDLRVEVPVAYISTTADTTARPTRW